MDQKDLEAKREQLQSELAIYAEQAQANIYRLQGAIAALTDLIEAGHKADNGAATTKPKPYVPPKVTKKGGA